MRLPNALLSAGCCLALGVVLGASGCVSPLGQQLADEADQSLPAAAAASCLVEIHPAGGKPRQHLLPLGSGLSVNGALEQTGAARKYRYLEMTLVRAASAQVPQMHKLGVQWDAEQRQVPIETDYLLYPGDVLIVNEVQTTMLERALGDVLGPLGRMGK